MRAASNWPLVDTKTTDFYNVSRPTLNLHSDNPKSKTRRGLLSPVQEPDQIWGWRINSSEWPSLTISYSDTVTSSSTISAAFWTIYSNKKSTFLLQSLLICLWTNPKQLLAPVLLLLSHLIGHHVEEVVVDAAAVHPLRGRHCASTLLFLGHQGSTFPHEHPAQTAFSQRACKDGILTSSKRPEHNFSNRPVRKWKVQQVVSTSSLLSLLD